MLDDDDDDDDDEFKQLWPLLDLGFAAGKNDLAGLLLSSFSFLFETSSILGEFCASLFSRISTVVQSKEFWSLDKRGIYNK